MITELTTLTKNDIDQLVSLFNTKKYAELESLAYQLINQFPTSGFTWKMLGVSLQMQGKEALSVLQKTTELSPTDAGAFSNFGIALQKLGRTEDAIVNYKRAIEINPNFSQAHNNFGNALQEQEKYEDAVGYYHRAIELNPDYNEAYNNLGSALKNCGRIDESIESFRRSIDPNSAESYNYFGVILHKLNRRKEAIEVYKKALQINPSFEGARGNLGNALFELGYAEEAKECYLKLIELNPQSILGYNNLGAASQNCGRFDEAIVYYNKILEIDPNNVEAHNNLGNSLHELKRNDEAIDCYCKAIELDPTYAGAYSNLGITLHECGRYEEAFENYNLALQIEPDHSRLHNNLGTLLYDFGQHEEALEHYRKAVENEPTLALTHSNLLFCLTHTETDPNLLLQEHLKFANQFESLLKSSWHHTNIKDPNKNLRIGILSADFHNHPVGNLLKLILKYLCTDLSLTVYTYYNNFKSDCITLDLQNCSHHWVNVFGMSDEILVKRIKDDGIDILVDLSGHTAGNCMTALLHKPAPIQATWLGYPGTTGTECIDYYIADRFFLPPEFADQFTEKLAYIPATFVPNILDYDQSPLVSTLPMIDNGFVTFGSFNRRNKISKSVVSTWSEILRTLPTSNMIIGGVMEHQTLIEWFEQNGITSDRLTFFNRLSLNDFMKTYNYVDICLDTFPYTGGITTIYGTWMGVPTVTLAGNTAVGRLTALTLGQVGLTDLIAHNKEEFVRLALNLANDPDRLSIIRSELRDRLKNSPMGQPKLVADALSKAFRTMWQRWCADLPPILIG